MSALTVKRHGCSVDVYKSKPYEVYKYIYFTKKDFFKLVNTLNGLKVILLCDLINKNI